MSEDAVQDLAAADASAELGELTAEQVEIPETTVYVGTCHPSDIAAGYYHSMVATLFHDYRTSRRLLDSGRVNSRYTSAGGLSRGRNEITQSFVESGCEWLWFIDADMTWSTDTLDQLLIVAYGVEDGQPIRRIVSALAFGMKSDSIDHLHAPVVDIFPVIYAQNVKTGGYTGLTDFPPNALIKCGAVGAACLLIHRSVIEEMHERWGEEWWSPWALTIADDGSTVTEVLGEDLSFHRRAQELGIDRWLHTGIIVGHAKDQWLHEESYRRRSQQLENHVMIPAKIDTDELYEMTKALVEQLVNQNEADTITVYDNGSPAKYAEAMKVWTTLPTPRGQRIVYIDASTDGESWSLHRMWNHYLTQTRESGQRMNLHFLNNDLRLGPHYIRGMADALRSSWDVALACPRYDVRPGTGRIDVTEICAGRYDGSGGLAGFAFAMRSGAEHTYSFPEPEGGGWWFGDNDMLRWFLGTGGRAIMDLDVAVEHLDGGGKSGGDWSEFAEAIRIDQADFTERWSNLTEAPAGGLYPQRA